MKKGQNFNRPKRGSTIKVDPIKSVAQIKTIKKLLEGRPLDYALFAVGINTNLRASDLLGITVGQVRRLKPGEEIVLTEKKTGKPPTPANKSINVKRSGFFTSSSMANFLSERASISKQVRTASRTFIK